MKNLGLFATFYMNLHTRSRSQAQKLGLRLRLWLHQKVAAPPAPAPQHCHKLILGLYSKKFFELPRPTTIKARPLIFYFKKCKHLTVVC
jgi:hypothetical protein